MEIRWLHQSHGARGGDGQSHEAIVVFSGWAVASDVFDHLSGPYDVLFVSDYRDLDADLPDLSGYGQVSLIAWSFGVASYAHWQQGRSDPFGRKVAVNGTLTPVNRATGVPPVAMSKTIEALSADAYQLFLTRVFNARQPVAEIDTLSRRDELKAVAARGDAPIVAFDRIWISSKDKIFPCAHQLRAWPEGIARQIQAPHAPFAQFTTWQELLA